MQRRVEDLEVKVAYLEKLIEDLDEVVRSQADAIDRLARELKELREEVVDVEDEGHQVPPHY
ncbi:MAG: SlyX family protein [Deltaproteobacteria bacterium]|nr:MAG: SlyX family protein [Deltaproteobacteria bacterium]